MRMLKRAMCGVSRLDRIRNEYEEFKSNEEEKREKIDCDGLLTVERRMNDEIGQENE